MLTIIKIEPEPWGAHLLQTQSHRTENWMGEGWIAVPETLEAALYACGGYCELEIRDGALVGLTPTARPPEPEPAPTAQEDAEAMLVDHEYLLTLLELGLGEEVTQDAVPDLEAHD